MNFLKRKFINKEESIGDNGFCNYPKVVYENNGIKREILEWVKFLGGEKFEQVLLDIGFNKDDIVYLYEKNNNLEYCYSVNEDEKNTNNFIKLSFGAFMDRGSSIDIWNNEGYKNYSFVEDNFDNEKRIFKLSINEKKISRDISYRRYFDSYYALFEIKNKDYKFEFIVSNYSNDKENIIKLDNEDKLEEYLVNLIFPVDIIDVYKNIVDICNLDVSKYQSFEIKIIPSKVGKKGDMIELKDGEFIQINMTKNGKRICLNKNDVWSYEMVDDDSLAKFSMFYSNNNVSYNISSKNNGEMNEYVESLLEYDISMARSEVDDVKKLVRMLFNHR